jgi:MOSC domain-containing protein YiiM
MPLAIEEDSFGPERIGVVVIAHVSSVAARNGHSLGKYVRDTIMLIAGQGVEGDAHCGTTVKHRSRVAKDPTQPNLRQVHLIHAELFDMLAEKGFAVGPAMMGENITTRGIDLLGLSARTRLQLGDEAVIEITGLRNPCHQLNGLIPGLMDAVLDRASDGSLIRMAGVMAIVISGGIVAAGDKITICNRPAYHIRLQPV